ncbi:hypothetical protein, partial [Thiolapillus sp.]
MVYLFIVLHLAVDCSYSCDRLFWKKNAVTSMQDSGIEVQSSPNISPESGIFPERFLPRLFERTKVDVIHRLAG